MKFRFPIVIIDEDFRSENTSGLGIRALADAIEGEGYEVMGVTSYGDLSQFAQQQSRASAFILSIDDEEFTPGPDLDPAVMNLRDFIQEVRRKNTDVPIYVYGETKTSRHLPNDILRELHGFIHMFEDTPEFVARHIIREAKVYLDSLAPPFFKALTHYASDGSYSWHCPGHSGGVAFLKSPVGQMFHQFFGENMLRADVCNAVDELGQLLDHTGPVAASERNAARIFNADHLFFVTNGTSTSNKIVWHSTVAPGDIVYPTGGGYTTPVTKTGNGDKDRYSAIFIGDNAFGHAISLPVELRDGGILDFGREHALAWYAIYGLGLITDQSVLIAETN